MSAYLFLSGVGVYVFSTLLDTLDVLVHAKLRALAHVLTANPGFVMSDAWYLLWSIKNSLNGFEEVFEHTAALLFLIALVTILFDGALANGALHACRAWKKRVAVGAVVMSVFGVAALIVLSVPLTFPSSPVMTSGLRVTQIASRAEGLFHTDDLAFHPSQGIIVANEGGSSLYRLKGGQLSRISDPKKIIQDPDSVTANEEGVFVSDGNAGTIVRFDKEGGQIIARRSDGLAHPEGITVAGADIYIVDESQKALSRYRPGGKIENWKPSHPEWQTPEGISYDRAGGSIYITDDTTGAVFRVVFGKSVDKIAQLSAPEDIEVLSDGSMLATDTAWGAVFRIFPDGRKEKIIRLARMYRDTQGVTIDENGSVYLVTADGFASTSFMPSFLFRIDDTRL
jgi:streptogramin lyase